MTVTYGDKSFVNLLFRWRGSVWKSIWKKLIVYLIVFHIINFSYRFAMNDKGQKTFEYIVRTFSTQTSLIPLQFLLGFLVNNIVTRWWDQVNNVAWPDKFLLLITTCIHGSDAETRAIRRTFARLCNLLNVLVWKEISTKIRKRFPTNEHLMTAGLLTKHEYDLLMQSSAEHGRWFMPVSWMCNLIARCHKEGRIDDMARLRLVEVLYSYRALTATLTLYDWINIPLAYTQIATIGTYGYFLFALLARQTLVPKDKGLQDVDLYFPYFLVLEFIFYFGWLGVAESLRCPFGEDDDDVEMNYVLDRNVYVSYLIVDELHDHDVPCTQDIWWTQRQVHLPHTVASYQVRDAIPDWRLNKLRYRIKDGDKEWRKLSEQARAKEEKRPSVKRTRSLDVEEQRQLQTGESASQSQQQGAEKDQPMVTAAGPHTNGSANSKAEEETNTRVIDLPKMEPLEKY